jgi:hypothetical protein
MVFCLPRAAAFEDFAIGRDSFVLRVVDAEILGQVRVELGTNLVAEGFLFRSKLEIHFDQSVEVEGFGRIVP